MARRTRRWCTTVRSVLAGASSVRPSSCRASSISAPIERVWLRCRSGASLACLWTRNTEVVGYQVSRWVVRLPRWHVWAAEPWRATLKTARGVVFQRRSSTTAGWRFLRSMGSSGCAGWARTTGWSPKRFRKHARPESCARPWAEAGGGLSVQSSTDAARALPCRHMFRSGHQFSWRKRRVSPPCSDKDSFAALSSVVLRLRQFLPRGCSPHPGVRSRLQASREKLARPCWCRPAVRASALDLSRRAGAQCFDEADSCRDLASAKSMRKASCSCGQLSAIVVGEPIRVGVCHGLACQQRTGSVFGAQARFPSASVSVVGESREYVRTGDSGGQACFHFCPVCGSTVFYTFVGNPEHTAIPVGAFADPTFPTPIISVYEERMHSWITLPSDIEHLP